MADKVSPAMQKALDDAKRDMAERTEREKAAIAATPTALATMNLFREADGSVRITISGATGAIREYNQLNSHLQHLYPRPIDYVESLIRIAAERFGE